MAWLVWDASQPKPESPDYFNAVNAKHAAEMFAQMYWDMGNWRVDAVYCDDENGNPPQLVRVKRVERFEAQP
jgi:hypothetical protein